MLQRNLLVRIAGPTVLVSLLLLGLSIAAAFYLYLQQDFSASGVVENVSSAQIALTLANTLVELEDALPKPGEPVKLHADVREQLQQARKLADKPREQELVGELERQLADYFAIWTGHDKPLTNAPLDQAHSVLKEARRLCRNLEEFNTQESSAAAASHRQQVDWMIGGLIGVGTMGALAGLFLGYAAARGLQQSIYHLSVRVQDAANKLGQDLPAVAVQEDGDLHNLHEQMRGVVREIEQVVKDLQQREREVLRAEQLAAVGQLAAGVAHELRNPLTSIKLLIQTNREEAALRGTPAEDLEVIEKEIRRMERSLQNFLDFARPPKPDRRLIDLTTVIERTLALTGGRIRKQHVDVRFEPRLAPALVEADAEQLQQVMVNLTLNALDVMPGGGVLALELTQARTADGRDWVEVRVSDTGPGIAPEMAPKLFQPFISSKDTGLGLGLVISRRIVDNHGGSLFAADRSGGATFVLRLPTANVPQQIPA
jgi:two-component system, NtrC family, sensor histidine kinase HydH